MTAVLHTSWHECGTAAIQAARHLGDRLGQGGALNDLGAVRRLTGDYPAAVRALEQALRIYRDLATGSARPAPSTTSGTSGG